MKQTLDDIMDEQETFVDLPADRVSLGSYLSVLGADLYRASKVPMRWARKALLHMAAGALPQEEQLALQRERGKEQFDAGIATGLNAMLVMPTLYGAAGYACARLLGMPDQYALLLGGVLLTAAGAVLGMYRTTRCVHEEGHQDVCGDPLVAGASRLLGKAAAYHHSLLDRARRGK